MFQLSKAVLAACLVGVFSGCGGAGAAPDSSSPEPIGVTDAASPQPPSDAGTSGPAQTPSNPPPSGDSSGTDDTSPSPADVAPYDASALPVLDGESATKEQWPAWRLGMSRWQWRQIPNTDLSLVVPIPTVPGALSARVDAWNGLAADTRTNRLYSAANGGHADYAGNEVYEIDLSVDAPKWKILRSPTAPADIVASNGMQGIFNDYYRDGRPASTHTYYALNFLSTRNAIFKFAAGSLWGTGNEGNWKTDAFSLSTNDWHPANTWPDAHPGSRSGVIAPSICKDQATEQVYLATPGNLRRFEPDSGSFTALSTWPENSSAVYARGCAIDSGRRKVVFFGDAYRPPSGGLLYDIASDRLSSITFTGDNLSEITAAGYNFAWHEPKVDQYLVKTGTRGHVYAVDPETFAVSSITTIGATDMPDAANGVHTRWQRLPKLGGYAYYPRHGFGIWFLAIE